jgi:FkbM family methyltransferase
MLRVNFAQTLVGMNGFKTMKLRNFLELIGLRQAPQRYAYRLKDFSLKGFGNVGFAQWLHPRAEDYHLDESIVGQFTSFIRPGDFCIDIGAHCGDSTLPIALAAGADGAVLALEPNPFVFPVLEKNARLNRDKALILPLLAAAGKEAGAMEFEYSDSGFCNGGRHENISVWKHGHPYKLSVLAINLAQELRQDFPERLQRLRFIKVDAEGYDLYVLQGIADIIDEFRPYVKAEVFKKSDEAYRRQLFEFFLSRGYELRRVAKEPCLPGEVLSLADLMVRPHFDIFCPKPWTV